MVRTPCFFLQRRTSYRLVLGLIPPLLLGLLFHASAAQAQEVEYPPSRLISITEHPDVRTIRMNEAWQIYQQYRAALQREAQRLAQAAAIREDIQIMIRGSWLTGTAITLASDLPQQLTAANAALEHERQTLRRLEARWRDADLEFGEFYLGPLNAARHPVAVTYGVDGNQTTEMDPIRVGLIRWDQAVAEAEREEVQLTTLDGRWHLSQGPHLAELIISGGAGTIRFYHLPVEPISGVSFDPASGEMAFFRPTYPQTFSGTVNVRDDGYVWVEGIWVSQDGQQGAWNAQLEE